MSTVEDIERAVQGLAAEQMAAFRAWLAEIDAAVRDRQLWSSVR